ncbi:MAG: alpha/beta hydrolase [Parvibaculum sp.]
MIWLFAILFAAFIVYVALLIRQTEKEFPLHGATIRSHGVDLHYVDIGPLNPDDMVRAPIILVHGASGNLRDFEASLIPLLADKHRVIAFDRPGHGWSERPDLPDIHDPARQAAVIHEAVTTLGVERPVLLGHSWGGAVASAYALAFGSELSGLLVLAGATHPWKGKVAWYHRLLATPLLGTLFLWSIVVPLGRGMAAAGVRSTFAPDPAPDGYEKAIGLSLLFRPKHFRHNSTDTSRLRDYLAVQSERYHEISVPTVIITGNRDQTVLAKLHSYALHEQISGSELIKLEGVGHMPHHVRPDVIVEALTRLAAGEAVRSGLHVYEAQSDAQKAALL